jgi:hypothetical protein
MSREFDLCMRQIERLVQKLEDGAPSTAQKDAQELASALLQLHRAGLSRMIELGRNPALSGSLLVEAWARDPAIAGLLLLHELHPHEVKTRILGALEQLRLAPGTAAELAELSGSRVTVRTSAPSVIDATLKTTVEEAIRSMAPEIDLVELEVAPTTPTARRGLPVLPR